MPYKKISNLPDPIRKNLPKHAQEIYKEAFNHALEHYGDEETAIKVAWAAVKKLYEKGPTGKWTRKDKGSN